MKRFFSVAFFKDKKNIAILALIVLLLVSFSTKGNQRENGEEYKVQIQKLTKSNEEVNMPRNTRFDRVVTMTEADAINAGKRHTSKE